MYSLHLIELANVCDSLVLGQWVHINSGIWNYSANMNSLTAGYWVHVVVGRLQGGPHEPHGLLMLCEVPSRRAHGSWGLLLTTDRGFFCDYTTYACPHTLASLEEADGHSVNCLGRGTMQEAAGVPRSCGWALANAQPSLKLSVLRLQGTKFFHPPEGSGKQSSPVKTWDEDITTDILTAACET